MAPMGIDFEQRDEDKRARMHLGMRQNEPSTLAPALRPAEAPAAIIEDVDIEAARTPTGAQASSRAALDFAVNRVLGIHPGEEPDIGRFGEDVRAALPAGAGAQLVRGGEDTQSGARQLALRAA